MSRLAAVGMMLSWAVGLSACEPALHVGDLTCAPSDGGASSTMDNGVFNDGALPAPWQTSFEDGFCTYKQDAGFCYEGGGAGYRLVTSPVRTGPFAAAFDLGTADGRDGVRQTRCVREGTLPESAFYSAWYYVPNSVTAAGNWNLFHFRGGRPGQRLLGLWDVSLEVREDGQLTAFVLSLARPGRYRPEAAVPIPIGRWFQLEFFLKRAADATGEIALYQDGEELVRAEGIVTDDTPFGQWYVGNYADSLTPPRSTLYVDDVSVRLGP